MKVVILTIPWMLLKIFAEIPFSPLYIGAEAVNGANGRYYEPAAGRTVYAGVTVGR